MPCSGAGVLACECVCEQYANELGINQRNQCCRRGCAGSINIPVCAERMRERERGSEQLSCFSVGIAAQIYALQGTFPRVKLWGVTVSFPPRLDKYPAPCDSSESWLALPLSLWLERRYTPLFTRMSYHLALAGQGARQRKPLVVFRW